MPDGPDAMPEVAAVMYPVAMPSFKVLLSEEGQKDYSKPAQRTVSLASIQDVLDEIRDALESWTSRDFAFKNRRIFMTL
eukprot:symbB.v1.2.041265.t1/scaffold7983.1/size10581/1